MAKIGDYVLGTAYQRGLPTEPFAIGFIKIIIIDSDGKSFVLADNEGRWINSINRRFLKVTRITKEEGAELLKQMRGFNNSYGSPSVYNHLKRIRRINATNNRMDRDH